MSDRGYNSGGYIGALWIVRHSSAASSPVGPLRPPYSLPVQRVESVHWLPLYMQSVNVILHAPGHLFTK